MKRMICTALITLVLPGLVHADGRYQMLPLGDQMGIGAEKIVILDTVSGHLWTWTEHAATRAQGGGRYLIYQGQVTPERQAGDVVRKEEWGERGVRTPAR
jgi:hypothetical protein